MALENQAVLQQQHVDAKIVDALIKKGAGSASADWTPCKHRTGAAKAHDWACGRLAACFRSTGTKVKTQRAVTAVDGNKRGDLELVAYISNGAQDLVLDLSFRHYRGGAAPRNWHRNGELLHPGQPDKDLDQKAESKIAKYRELYRDHHRQLDFLPAIASTSSAPLAGFIAS